MSIFGQISRKLFLNNVKYELKTQINNNYAVCIRLLSYQAMHYDGKTDPGPIFMKKEVQSLLKTLTRVDLAKVFRKRKLGDRQLEQPVYKFMTDEELKQAFEEAKNKADEVLQIPPIVSVRRPRNAIISRDPALQGLDTSTWIFTDITYGVPESQRTIVVRDPDGTLKEADWELRDRINQMYFPVPQRQVRIPRMFQDEYLEKLLKKQEYNFILDRACLQFEPNDRTYQKVVSITYQHINDNNKFEDLRSTRHFGSFAFFLSWHKMCDNLLLDLIETDHIEEANALVDLHAQIHKVKFESSEDLNKVEEYIKKFSSKKAALELALQAYKNALKRKQELDEGVKRAHGFS